MTTPAHISPPTVPPKTSSTSEPPSNLLFRPPQVWDVCIRLSKCPGRYRSNAARGLGLIWRPGNLIRFCVPASRIAPAALHYLDRPPFITSLLLTWCCGPLYWTVLPPGRLTANDRSSLILLGLYFLFFLAFHNRLMPYRFRGLSLFFFFCQLQFSVNANRPQFKGELWFIYDEWNFRVEMKFFCVLINFDFYVNIINVWQIGCITWITFAFIYHNRFNSECSLVNIRTWME